MDERGAGKELAAALRALKDMSGLSYTELARRTLTTSSSLHRYCTGAVVPPDYRTVASLAEVAGADRAELATLAVLWSRARAGESRPEDGGGQGEARPEDGGGQPEARPEEGGAKREARPGPAAPARRTHSPARPSHLPHSPARPSRLRPSRSRLARWLLTAALLLVPAASAASLRHTGPPAPAYAGPPGGSSWAAHPWPLDPAAMGVTMNSNTGRMPSFGVGSVRLWDSGTRWADLEPRPGDFAWAPLDRLVDGARAAGLATLYTAGGTPAWAVPGGARSVYADDSRSAPPDALSDWDRFVRALVTRYRGRIGAYELWDTATDAHFYSGSPKTLARMARRAAAIIHGADPSATVVCPSLGSVATPSGAAFLRGFAAARGFDGCDVAAVKVRQRPARVAPEDLTDRTERFIAALHDRGVGLPVWITGPDYDVSKGRLRGTAAANWAARFYLALVYEHLHHVRRAYFYDWGGSALPVVLQPDGQAPTAAGRAVGRLHAWLAGAWTEGCGHGHAAGLPAHAWRCALTHTATPGGRAVIAWTDHATARVAAPYARTTVHRLDGGTGRAGHDVSLGEAPVLLTE